MHAPRETHDSHLYCVYCVQLFSAFTGLTFFKARALIDRLRARNRYQKIDETPIGYEVTNHELFNFKTLK